VLRDEQIGEAVENLDEPQRACEELVRQTLDGGAPDNVTVVAVKFFESENGAG
jgi:serine/threonine protein phosphatase PrpC